MATRPTTNTPDKHYVNLGIIGLLRLLVSEIL